MSESAPGNDAGSLRSRPQRRRFRLRLWHVIVAWAMVMTPLCGWGLPSRAADDLLFGGEAAWSAERFQAAQALQQRERRGGAADTDLDPIRNRKRLVELTADDAARAEILLRYRLYSRQPDEMITFMALQRMRPRQFDFDPRLYQYGGGYIYLIGGCIGATSACGVTRLTGDVGVYLEQPELFGRFYIVARLVSLAFGAAALVAVVRLARRAGGRAAGWIAFACVAASPVFITGVLEAKPHLPSTCMILWATESAIAYLGRGRFGDAARAGLQAGYAFGLVLTGVVASFALAALLLVRRRRAAPLLLALVLFATVYIGTNPYVVYNTIFNPAALASNLDNSTAMYTIDRLPEGAARVGVLMVEGCGWGVLIAGVIGALVIARRHPGAAVVAAAPAVALLAITIAIGAGKPAEFARFLLLPASLLGVAAGVALAWTIRESRVAGYAIALAVVAFTPTAAYLNSFLRDTLGADESRRRAGRMLAQVAYPLDAIGVLQEPAPYALPPLDFARRRIVLLPQTRPPRGELDLPEWLVYTADDERAHADAWWRAEYRFVERVPATQIAASPIAWANKPVFIFLRNNPTPSATPPN